MGKPVSGPQAELTSRQEGICPVSVDWPGFGREDGEEGLPGTSATRSGFGPEWKFLSLGDM